MSRWRRRPQLPDEVLAAMEVQRGERPLAWACGRDGQWYVGTDRALHLPVDSGMRRVGWEFVERAEWQREDSVLAVVELAGWGEPQRITRIELDSAGLLLQLIRERVTKSIVVSVHAAVRGRAGLTVVGRRSPVGNGPVSWSYVLAASLRPEDELVRQVADRTLLEAKAEVSWLPT